MTQRVGRSPSVATIGSTLKNMSARVLRDFGTGIGKKGPVGFVPCKYAFKIATPNSLRDLSCTNILRLKCGWGSRWNRVITHPYHLGRDWRKWHTPQYIKALDASFPPDRWPAEKIVRPDGSVRFVLKDRTDVLYVPPPPMLFENSWEATDPVRLVHLLSTRRAGATFTGEEG